MGGERRPSPQMKYFGQYKPRLLKERLDNGWFLTGSCFSGVGGGDVAGKPLTKGTPAPLKWDRRTGGRQSSSPDVQQSGWNANGPFAGRPPGRARFSWHAKHGDAGEWL